MTLAIKPVLLGAVLALGGGAAYAQVAPVAGGHSSSSALKSDVQGPGRYAAWPVVSNDNIQIGNVVFAPETVDGHVAYVVVRTPSGNQFKLENGISVIPNAISIDLSKAQVDQYTVDRFTNIRLQ